ncbi:Os01g0878000, partial [Oryza sativa Japonica Group]
FHQERHIKTVASFCIQFREDNLQGAGANLNSEGRRRAGCNLQEAKKRPRQAAMSGRSRPWPGDPSPAPPQPPVVAAAADAGGEASTSLRDFGTSMDAISFGFAATAILVSMFLLMAIFEHLIKPHVFPPLASAALRPARRRHGVSPAGKLRSPPMVRSTSPTTYTERNDPMLRCLLL